MTMDLPTEYSHTARFSLPEEQTYAEEFELPSLTQLDPDDVCKDCLSIPFHLLGFHRNILMEELDQHFNLRDRPLTDVFETSDKCLFCQKITLLFKDFHRRHCGNLPIPELGRVTVEIMPNWLHSVEKDDNGHCEGRLLRLGVEFCFWDFTPDSGFHSPNFVFQRCNVPVLEASDSCADQVTENGLCEGSQPYNGRVRPLVADLQVFQKWKELCIEHHKQDCGAMFMGEQLSQIRLIDVEDMCIVEAPQDQEYVALSYVWGRAEMLKLLNSNLEVLQRVDSLKSMTLPATIHDAVEVTRGIGERYLWVDALCIIQDDQDDKAYFIPKMDIVYGCALLTIIAMFGDGAAAGLPRVRPGSRNRQEVPFIIKETSIIASLDPVRTASWRNYLGYSRWDSRGWTFQERTFSRRAMIFTSDQVYWECQKASWCEDGNWEVLKYPHIFRMAFNTNAFLFPWPPGLSSFEKMYKLLVEKYTSRNLSFQSDCLKAFTGIIHAAERTWDQIFFWGLPCSVFSSALQWKINREGIPKRRITSVDYQIDDDDYSTITQLPVPSWTWAGWENDISMANFDSQGMAIELKLYRMSSKDQLIEINELSQQPTRSEEDTLRRKWKKVDDAVVRIGDLPPEALSHPFRPTFLIFWSSSALLAWCWVVDFKENLRPVLLDLRFAWMHLPPKPTILRGTTKFEASEPVSVQFGEFVVIGRDMHIHVGDCSDMLMLMLLEREGDIVYRRGLISVAEEDWVKCSLSWKLFVLG